MALTIDQLEIQIDTNAKQATNGLDSLAASLAKLKTVVGATSGLASNLIDIAAALQTFSAVGKVRMTVPVNQLKKLESVIPTLGSAQATQMADNLRKIADSIATFSATSGVGKQMKDAAKGMDALAKSSVKYEAAMKKSDAAHKGTLRSLSGFVNQYRHLYHVIGEVVDVCADLFVESNEYIEALNLFKVSMGEASDEALEYAENLKEALGIDPAEWITYQGTFQRMATGFGIASEEAEIMSQNLTQLAYDMASFFNTDVLTATQKLQSGMSGQIKGLKAWGYNLSVAALQETALNLGIEESVRNMTEAQKAQLRYITLIQRSNGIMGDMAKTINTPANALRVLKAQIELFKRSLGNLVSIIATKVIPYVQAFVELMAEAAESLAKSWGFEIKDLPTNNLEMGAEVIDGIGDNVEDTTDAVSELKKQLMGFDELNILKTKDDGDESGTGAQNSLNISLPEYDFLSNLDTATRERIDAIKERLKDLFPILETLGKAFLLAFAVKTFYNAASAIKHFFAETKLGVGIVQAFALSFGDFAALAKNNGFWRTLGNSFKNLGKNIKSAMSSMQPLTKAIVSVVALGVEFNVVKNAAYDFAAGNKSLGETLLAIVPVCGLVGTAMYAMLGPWGIALAAITGVTAAVVGFVKAEKEAQKQLAHDTFYAEYGTKVTDLAKSFGSLMTASTDAYDTILQKQSSILTAKENIKGTLSNVNNLVFGVENGAIKIEEAIPTIVDAFETLYDDTKGFLTDTRDLIIGSLSGSIGEVLKEQGVIIEDVVAGAGKITQDALTAIDALNAKNDELTKQWEAGSITDDAYFSQLAENIALIQQYSHVQGEEAEAMEDARKEFANAINDALSGNLTWDDPDGIENVLSGITESAKAAKDTIKEAYGAVIEALEVERDNALLTGDNKLAALFEKTITATTTGMNKELESVESTVNSVVDALQLDLLNKVSKEYDAALAEYENKSDWFKFWNADESYVQGVLKEYEENEFALMSEAIKKIFPDADFWADDALSEIIDNIIVKEYTGTGYTYVPHSDIGSLIQNAIPESAKDTIAGLTGALEDGNSKVYDAGKSLGDNVKSGYDDSLDINSPSREMEKRGEYSIQGLVEGLSNTSLLKVAIDNIVQQFDILSPIKRLWDKVSAWWQNLSLPDINLFGNLGAKISGAFNIGQYASGGFPTMGQFFIARERGPELVGRIGNKNAVANNDQIITGIASAVYSAMMAAHEDGKDGNGGSARIVVQIGDEAVGEASVRYINGKIVQTGTSPIYG